MVVWHVQSICGRDEALNFALRKVTLNRFPSPSIRHECFKFFDKSPRQHATTAPVEHDREMDEAALHRDVGAA
jgi:hypothetical protein